MKSLDEGNICTGIPSQAHLSWVAGNATQPGVANTILSLSENSRDCYGRRALTHDTKELSFSLDVVTSQCDNPLMSPPSVLPPNAPGQQHRKAVV